LQRPFSRIRAAEDRHFDAAVFIFPLDAPVVRGQPIFEDLR
jgi:hypothetical protein